MPPPQKKTYSKGGGGGFWCLSLILPGFFWWGKASMSNLHWKNDGNGFLDLINISDGVHKLQSSKVFLIYYKPYVSDILLINVNLYDISVFLATSWGRGGLETSKMDSPCQKTPILTPHTYLYSIWGRNGGKTTSINVVYLGIIAICRYTTMIPNEITLNFLFLKSELILWQIWSN